MAGKRTYGDRCGIARALDIVGERWSLLVVRELLLGPKRFTDLREGLPNVSPDVLTERLRELEDAGVVARRKLAPPAASRVYELTERGRELEPVLLHLGRWGSATPVPTEDADLGADAAAIALKSLFDPAAADGVSASYTLRLAEQSFKVSIDRGSLELARGEAEKPHAVIEAEPGALAAVLWHGRPLTDAETAGEIRIDGNRWVARRFLALFPLPAG